MKKNLIKIGREVGLELDIRLTRVSFYELGYTITHNGKYVFSENCYTTIKGSKLRLLRTAKSIIKNYSDRYYAVQIKRDNKLKKLL